MANTKKYVSLDKLGLYDEKIKKVIADSDAAALVAAEAQAKKYADSLATNYDAAGSAATAESNANTYTDGKIEAVNGVVASVKTTAEQGVSDAAKAKAAADKAQGEVDALEAYVGTFTHDTAKSVVEYINAKTDGIATSGNLEALGARVTTVEGDVATIKGDYLKSSDKTALQDAIDLKADQTALDAVSGVANAAATKVALDAEIKTRGDEITRVEGLVSEETERATGVESGLNERLESVEAFFKLAEGETLDTALDTLKEIQTYITSEGAAADQMVQDIAANAKAIEDEAKRAGEAESGLSARIKAIEDADHDFGAADTALKTELMTEINKKADSTALASAVQTLEGADSVLSGRIEALEAKHGNGEGTVESMIAAAQAAAEANAAADATSKANTAEANAKAEAVRLDGLMNARVETLEAASATHALASDLNTLAGRVTTAEGKITTLEGKMDAVEALAAANKAAHEANAAAIALKASQADLNAVSGRVTTLETWHNNFSECSEDDIKKLFGEVTA